MLSEKGEWKEVDDWFAYAKTLPTIAEEMKNLPRPQSMDKTVYLLHMPPARLGLDKCANGTEVGSKAIYDFIDKNQPLLTLHGHIHESPRMTGKWSAQLGKSVCIQPGQLDDFAYVVIDLESMNYERFLLGKP